MIDFEKLLNEAQLEAATAPDGPLLVLAAAGTGKTRTLVYRVAHLVEKGVEPHRILLLTFTNRAAKEMLERAREVAGERVSQVWGGTFHHVANKILRRHAPRLGYPHDFQILDSDDQRSLVSQIMKERKLTAKDFMRREVLLSFFSGARNRKQYLDDFLETKLDQFEVNPNDILAVYDDYEARKFKLQSMDFDDLLINVLRLLNEHEDVLRQYQELFRHVLVDEYQDTNILQAEMVELLAGGTGNLSVVGDDFQCIYTWRGADFRNIMDFPQRHPETRIVKLEHNYRSVPGVLDIANACIAGNPQQFQKTLRPTREAASRPPRFISVYDGEEQTETILDLIRLYRRQGYQYSDMAVLYRAHFHSIELQVRLMRSRMPFTITSGIGVFEQAHVKDVLCLLRLAENPEDRLAFDRVLDLLKGAGPSTIGKLWLKIGESFDATDAAERDQLRQALSPRLREQWEPIHHLLISYHEDQPRMTADEFMSRFLNEFYRDYLHRTYERPEEREEDLGELAKMINRSPDMRTFLSEVALLTNVDHIYEQKREQGDPHDKLTMSTVHQAKGLEWPIVFIPWAVEGMFPSSRSLAEDDGGGSEAEERRLFYVAVTRARDDLVVLSPRLRMMRDGGIFSCSPSRFVKEIPPDLISEIIS